MHLWGLYSIVFIKSFFDKGIMFQSESYKSLQNAPNNNNNTNN